MNWSLIHGDERVCLSMFYYSTGVDNGPVIGQRSVPVSERDDVDTVFDQLSWAACDMLADHRESLHEGKETATEQSLENATYRPRRRPQDGLVEWTRSAQQLFDWVRAQTQPYPGAYSFCDAGKLILWECDLIATDDTWDIESTPPGTIVEVNDGIGFDVTTGTDRLRIKRVQLQDRPEMWADDFATRFGLGSGDVLGKKHAPDDWMYTGIRDSEGGTNYETNLRVDESATLLAVACVPNGSRDIEITSHLNDDLLNRESRTVSGDVEIPIQYTPNTAGTHTLKVEFSESESGDTWDRRFLKIFVPGS